MRRRLLGTAALAALAVCTSLITSAMLRQPSGRAFAQSRPNPPAASTQPNRAGGQDPRPFDQVGTSDAAFLMRDFRVSPDAASVSVHAAATIIDNRNSSSYVWKLQILDESNKEVFSMLYKNQIFSSLMAGQKIDPSFDERVPVGPGNYTAVLQLLDVPQGLDVNKLGDDKFSEQFKHLSGTGKVTVL